MGLFPDQCNYKGGTGEAASIGERSYSYFDTVRWQDGDGKGPVKDRGDILRCVVLTLQKPKLFHDSSFHHLFYVLGGSGFFQVGDQEPVPVSGLQETAALMPAGTRFTLSPGETLPKPYLSFLHLAIAPLDGGAYIAPDPVDRHKVKFQPPGEIHPASSLLDYFPAKPVDDISFRVRRLFGDYPVEGRKEEKVHKLIYVRQGSAVIHTPMGFGDQHLSSSHMWTLNPKAVMLIPAGLPYGITVKEDTGYDLELAVLSFKTLDLE